MMGDKFLLGPLKVFPLFHRHPRAAYILHDTQHTHTRYIALRQHEKKTRKRAPGVGDENPLG
jgi:hypothetical protein